MNPGAPVPTAKVARHSAQTIVAVRYWTPSLLSFRTSRPSGFRFTPGHYARLGLHDSNGGVVWRPLPVVTREHCPDALGMRIPQSIENGSLERAAGLQLDLASARIMVCGNPEMNRELRALLSARGFRTNRRAAAGQLAFENYWAGKPD